MRASCQKSFSFVLLEVLIALSLALALLGTLLFFYRVESLAIAAAKQERIEAAELLLAENRLARAFAKTTSPKRKGHHFETIQEPSPLFSPNSHQLLFTFDNGVDLDNPFSNQVIGLLFLSREHQLMLALWPASERWSGSQPPTKLYPLLSEVNALSFTFYSASEEGSVVIRNAPKTFWEQGKALPYGLVVQGTRIDQPPFSFAFVFPGTQPLITFGTPR